MASFRPALAGTLLLGLIAAPGGAAAEEIAAGTFEGQSDHVTSGGVAITSAEGGYALVLGDDFAFDGAPDPYLALGHDGYDAETQFAPLEANEGTQTYALPEGLDPASYNEVWLWCEQFSVPLGVARLQ